jgi:hypothetical protein
MAAGCSRLTGAGSRTVSTRPTSNRWSNSIRRSAPSSDSRFARIAHCWDCPAIINYLGARSTAFIGRLLEMAPFRKIVYSSDGFGPAELHYLGARLWRNGIRDVLQGFVNADEWSESDAMRVADLIARDNARRVYPLD